MGRSLLAQPRTVSSFLRSAMPLPPPVITRTSGARLSSCAEGLHNTSPPNERGHSQERSASLPAKGGGDDPPGTYWRRSGDVVKEEMLRCFQVASAGDSFSSAQPSSGTGSATCCNNA